MGSRSRLRPPGVPFSERGPDAIYRLTREGTPLVLELRINMRGTEYYRVEMDGIGTDGLPIQYSYRDHYNGRLGISMFKSIAASRGTEAVCLVDTRPDHVRRDLS